MVLSEPLLDRVLDVQPGRRARALRVITNTWPILDSHFPRFPVLPGVLLLDSMVALAVLAVEERGRAWRLANAERLRFRRFVRPGDVLDLTVGVRCVGHGIAECTSTARVDGLVVATAGLLRLADRAAPEARP